ncbi:MAG: hypothetical protein HZC51_08300 [Nitrospirae bacterium]|nr:hypothetical protein [Nitrospirota bacterium]
MKTGLAIRLIVAVCLICMMAGCDDASKTVQTVPPTQNPAPSPSMSPEKLLELQEKCAKAGRIFYDRYEAENILPDWVREQPEFHYSKKLNTYLIYIHYYGNNADGFLTNCYLVIDILSNKTILQGIFVNRDGQMTSVFALSENTVTTADEFYRQKELLFSE